MKTPEKLCYVCSKPVRGNDYISISTDIFRHKKCAVGSSNWLKSQVAEQSDFYNLFKDQITEAKNTTNEKPKKKKKTAMDEWLEKNRQLKDKRQEKKSIKPKKMRKK
jgi:hypothetical protein